MRRWSKSHLPSARATTRDADWPGRYGQTRLAIQAAANLVPDFKNGVFWVGLAALSDPAVVMQSVAEVVGAKGDIGEHIASQMLLVIDNSSR